MTPETYNSAMRILSPMLAVAFWAVAIMLLQDWRRHTLMLCWVLSTAAWWTLGAYGRLFGDYGLPTVAMSFLATVTHVQAAVSLLVWSVFARRQAPSGPPLYPTERGPDDD